MFPQPPSALADRTTTWTSGTHLWGMVIGRVGAGHDTAALVIVDQLLQLGLPNSPPGTHRRGAHDTYHTFSFFCIAASQCGRCR